MDHRNMILDEKVRGVVCCSLF